MIFLYCDNTELKRSSKRNVSVSERHRWAVVGLTTTTRFCKKENFCVVQKSIFLTMLGLTKEKSFWRNDCQSWASWDSELSVMRSGTNKQLSRAPACSRVALGYFPIFPPIRVLIDRKYRPVVEGQTAFVPRKSRIHSHSFEGRIFHLCDPPCFDLSLHCED